MVRALASIPRSTAWRIHHVAYVEKRYPRRQSNFSTARMSPRMPSWIRSSSVSSEPWYFFAIETTSRRFALIMRSLARRSPRSMRFARSISSDGVSSRWRPISLRKSCSVSVVTVANAASSIGASGASARVQSSRSSMCRACSCS